MSDTISVPREAYRQILNLAAEFVASVPFVEIEELIQTGPSAVRSRCFQWAWKAYDQLESMPELDATRASSLLGGAPYIRLLTQAAKERIKLVHGEPEIPALSELPEGIEVWTSPELQGHDDVRMSSRARLLCATTVHGWIGCSSTEWFYITSDRSRKHWVLWCKWDDDINGRTPVERVAWCDRTNEVSEYDGAVFLLEALWEVHRDTWETGPASELHAGEFLTYDELLQVQAAVWPESGE